MNRLSGVMRLESASCPHRAIPKGKHLRKDCQPERNRISERTASPKGNASQKGLPTRKESISEWIANPKGKHLRKDRNPERKRIPRE